MEHIAPNPTGNLDLRLAWIKQADAMPVDLPTPTNSRSDSVTHVNLLHGRAGRANLLIVKVLVLAMLRLAT